MKKADWIWHDGKIIPWEEAQVHVLTHSLHYGLAVFEGMRCYQQTDGCVGIFRHEEHISRLLDSAHLAMIDSPFDFQEIMQACREVVAKNKFKKGCYLRPLIYIGEGSMGIAALTNPVHLLIAGWEWGAYLGEEGLQNGIKTMISSHRRPRGDTFMSKGKICGQYANNILAKREALKYGMDEAIMLDTEGNIGEGSGENIFLVKNGSVFTPDAGSSILGGITRGTVITLLKDKGLNVVQQTITRDAIYVADEVFMTGTAAEITPVCEIDHRKIGTGKPGFVTKFLQKKYASVVRGDCAEYSQWIDTLTVA